MTAAMYSITEGYPQEFIDYLCNQFGLEWLDYLTPECYDEWQVLQEMECLPLAA